MTDIAKFDPNNSSDNNPYSELYSGLYSVAKGGNTQKYVPLIEENFDLSTALVKLIAFYLPQFHPIPENDEWWGKGFTEWTNVKKGEPNFVGHYQPRVPGELGYYDLRDIEIQRRQVELARKYGIYGFCFYYYWFNGKRLLELPLNQFIENNDLDFPFCICWANENWTRRWDGRDDDILIGQVHSEDEYAAFIRDVVPILLDGRYIRVDGRPLLAVYRINSLPNPQRVAEIWRAECQRLGVGEIYLVAVQSFDIEDPRPYGFDAAIEFPPHNCLGPATEANRSNLQITNPNFTGHVYEYRVAAQLMNDMSPPDYIKFKTVMPSWDNTARRQNSADLFINAIPEAYENWLKRAVDYTCKHLPKNQQYLFINAWNEWGEGAYLEPDRTFGYAFLQATLNAVKKPLESDNQELIRDHEIQIANLGKLLILEVAKKEQMLQSLKLEKEQKEQTILFQNQQLDKINQRLDSRTFKTALLLIKIRLALLPPDSVFEKPIRIAFRTAFQLLRILRSDGFFVLLKKIVSHFSKRGSIIRFPIIDYQDWIIENEPGEIELVKQTVTSKLFSFRPTISILTPVYNTPEHVLRATIQSVIDQTYDNWELCLVDGNSNDQTKAILEHFQNAEARIKCEFLAENLGISGNTNAALQCATGEYITLLDHDDLLSPFALFEIAGYINQNPDAEMVYGDEDHIDVNGHRHFPFFKPDWSPDLLQSFMYVGHSTYKKDLILSLGGFRSEFDFSQDYDLALRVTEIASHIGHIPKVLYHWRELPGSAAAGGKDYARESNVAALANALVRRGHTADVVALPTHNRVAYYLIDKPLISIIIPSDSPQNILKSIDAVTKGTSYPNYEILVIANSKVIETFKGKYEKENVKFISFDQEYNFSAKCNLGVSRAIGEYVLFLNDDVYPITNDWIEKMLGPFHHKGVGAVSPKMVYTNGTIQHAGLVTGVRNLVGTAFHTFPKDSTLYFNMAQCPRTVSALSAACLLMRRDVFVEIGGYDEINTPIMHSDLDLCFKIRDKGLRLVYMPEAELTHVGHLSIKEIESKNVEHSPKADAYLLKRWAKYVAYDPYFPNNMRDMLYIDSPVKIRIWATNQPESVIRHPDILIQTHDLSMSGVPIIAHDQAVDLVDRGGFVTIASAKSGELLEIYKSEGIPVIIDSLVLDSPQAMESFLVNFDAILANTIMAWRLVLTAKSLNIPVLWVIQEGDYGVRMARENKAIQRALSLADRVVFSSRQTLIKYSEFNDGNNYSSMFFGVEAPAGVSRFSKKVLGKKIKIIHIGSVEKRKGQDILVKALKMLAPDQIEQIEVSFIGRTLEGDFYKRQLLASANLKNIHWLGSLSHEQVWECLANSDILVCSSRDETGPLVVYEAMALGKAVISTPVGAVPEIIRNGVNGFIFSDSDQLSNLLVELCSNKVLIERLGEEAFLTYDKELRKSSSNEKIINLIKSMIP